MIHLTNHEFRGWLIPAGYNNHSLRGLGVALNGVSLKIKRQKLPLLVTLP